MYLSLSLRTILTLGLKQVLWIGLPVFILEFECTESESRLYSSHLNTGHLNAEGRGPKKWGINYLEVRNSDPEGVDRKTDWIILRFWLHCFYLSFSAGCDTSWLQRLDSSVTEFAFSGVKIQVKVAQSFARRQVVNTELKILKNSRREWFLCSIAHRFPSLCYQCEY